ncbi:MAG: molecular chaperone DnaJ [Chloroflexi bacterium]|nr:MAG: molecular chaperone DnaJ [Chloroflexota bacterium]
MTNAQQQDFYATMGVQKDASQEDIKRAFRKLAMEYHPDRNKEEGAEEKFKEVAAAYEVLSDPEKRSSYDRFGAAGVGAQGQGFNGFEGFGGFGDIFDAFFRGTASRRAGPQRGSDLRTQVSIEFPEAVFGVEREIEFERNEGCDDCQGTGAMPGSRPQTCPECRGTGELRRVQQSLFGQFVNVATCDRCEGEGLIVNDPCGACRGRGFRRANVKRTIKIPAGIDDSAQIRVSSEGDAGTRGGGHGNLYVLVRVQPHAVFQRDDNDLVYDLRINVAQAALGAAVDIPTLEGAPVALTIEPGTQHGQIFTINEKGVPYLRGSGRGDLLVHTSVVTPNKLSDEQRELFEKLAESMGTPAQAGDKDSSILGRIRDAFA